MRGRYVRERENKECGKREPFKKFGAKLFPAPSHTGLDFDLFSVGKALPQPFKTRLLMVADPRA